MAVRELWRLKKLTTRSYPIGGANVSASPTNLPIELTQYTQEDVFDKLIVHVTGSVVVAGAGPGTATGAPNPEGILSRLQMTTAPTYSSVIPWNNCSARSILTDGAFARGYFLPAPPIPDIAGTYPQDFVYELYFKRPNVRKGVEWAFYLQKYTSALLNLQFGGREQLFSGGTNTWDLSGLQVEIYADSDLAVQPNQIHASEVFEQTYPVMATQSDFPIDTLPPGYLYTDFMFQTEINGALADGVINNFDIEGGGRIWLPQGDNNAKVVRRTLTQEVLSDPNANLTGLYVIPLRDGMFSRAIDALTAAITIKLDVTKGANPTTIRMVCRRIIPGGVMRKPAPAQKVTVQASPGH